MNETVFTAAMFLILAFAGMEPGHAQITKTCKIGAIAEVFVGTC
ncbi:MAG: hypothetical protein WA822_11550 [Albidovulum sp.]